MAPPLLAKEGPPTLKEVNSGTNNTGLCLMTIEQTESGHLAMRTPPHDSGAFRYQASNTTTGFLGTSTI
jgi:hypothetical protein